MQRPARTPKNRARTALGLVFTLLGPLGCAPGLRPLLELPVEPAPRWEVRIHNAPGGTLTARVEDSRTGAAVRVYSGASGSLQLRGGDGFRTLLIEVGSQRFTSAEFLLTDEAPCWELTIDSPVFLQARSGPWPCRELDADKVELVIRAESVKPQLDVRKEITRLTECFAREFQLWPSEWAIHVSTVEAPDTVWAGRTNFRFQGEGEPVIADIQYELTFLREHPHAIRQVVLHEMLHIVTAALFVSFYDYDPALAVGAAEFVVQRMTPWPLWGMICR